MSESCKQPESHGIGTQGDSFYLLNNDGHSRVFRLFWRHTHTRTHAISPTILSLSLSLALLSLPFPDLHHISSSWRVQHSISEQSWEGQGRQSGPVWAIQREGICPLTLSISLYLLSLSLTHTHTLSLPLTLSSLSLFLSFSLVSRAASRETAKLHLPCHPGTDDKAWLFTGRRDPGFGTHTYGRQEWKEGISFSPSPPTPSLLQQQLLPPQYCSTQIER